MAHFSPWWTLQTPHPKTVSSLLTQGGHNMCTYKCPKLYVPNSEWVGLFGWRESVFQLSAHLVFSVSLQLFFFFKLPSNSQATSARSGFWAAGEPTSTWAPPSPPFLFVWWAIPAACLVVCSFVFLVIHSHQNLSGRLLDLGAVHILRNMR